MHKSVKIDSISKLFFYHSGENNDSQLVVPFLVFQFRRGDYASLMALDMAKNNFSELPRFPPISWICGIIWKLPDLSYYKQQYSCTP